MNTGTKIIPLTRGRVAVVDAEDYDRLAALRWCYLRSGRNNEYAVHYAHDQGKHGKTQPIYMHRLILNAPQGMQVDHVNGNGLDNRRSNIRLCTPVENCRNMRPRPGKYKGVWKQKNRYRASISIEDRTHHLGSFMTPEEAARAYDDAARRYHGEFAQTNF